MTISDRDKIIDKIKKCLRLAKSSNEHEAAAALRQAQKLMRAHGVSDLDVEHADIREEYVRVGAKSSPAKWEVALVDVVARAFDCQSVFRSVNDPRIGKAGFWVFIGAEPSGEIARYAFEVLYRQIKRARKTYIQTTLKNCTRQNRTRRVDLFCNGWVSAVSGKVKRLAGNVSMQTRIDTYMARKYGQLASMKGRDRNNGRPLSGYEMSDILYGQIAGREAEINHGLNGAGSKHFALGRAEQGCLPC